MFLFFFFPHGTKEEPISLAPLVPDFEHDVWKGSHTHTRSLVSCFSVTTSRYENVLFNSARQRVYIHTSRLWLPHHAPYTMPNAAEKKDQKERIRNIRWESISNTLFPLFLCPFKLYKRLRKKTKQYLLEPESLHLTCPSFHFPDADNTLANDRD